MKIFISHSSVDGAIARWIARDLDELGAETFLDEKDIETGDSIDDTIQQNMAGCDEVVVLVSPAAFVGHWVLMEIGTARAHDIRVVPILFHMSANDLPDPLRKGRARDLNEIEKYYGEVRRRIAGHAPATAPAQPASAATAKAEVASRRRRTFKVADVVRIPEHRQPTFRSAKGNVHWTDDMTPHGGKTATVTEVDDDRTVKLDVGSFWWAMDWLEPAVVG